MKISLVLIFAFLVQTLKAQQQQATTNDILLVQETLVKKFRGKEYFVSVDVKSVAKEGDGRVGFFALQIGKTDWDFIEKTRKTSKALKNNIGWQNCSFSGIIDANANKIWLYLLSYGNGDFYFDNIKMKIKLPNGSWQDIALKNGDFEKSSANNPILGFRNSKSLRQKKGVAVYVFKEQDPQYGNTLHIQSRNAKPDERIIYGYNKKAGHFARVNGIKIYYEIYGTGEPLLLLHGNGGSIISFSKQIAEFSKQYKVIAIDTRGHGNSADSTIKNFSYNQFAEDVKGLLDTLKLMNVSVLGWSDGGNTALILASKYPGYVKYLITMGANLNPSSQAVKAQLLKRTQRDINKIKAENGNSVTLGLLEMLLREPNIDPLSLKNITAKTLILAGEEDDILEKHTRLIASSIPQAQLNIIKGENHFVVIENPGLFNKIVLTFLAN